MYRRIQDFVTDWRQEAERTHQVFQQLTDASLDQRVSPDGRSLGRIAWHITETMQEMLGRTGLTLDGVTEGQPLPARAEEIADAYRAGADAVSGQVEAHWHDASLEERVDMYGETWPKGKILFVLIQHQTHHRGQMTVLMRQAGLPVPGVCGPSREEWAQWGMPADQ